MVAEGRQAHDHLMETVNDTIPPTDPPPYKRPGSRLTRSTDEKVVAGLSGGLGRYFGIDPVVFRIAFVVLTLAGGSGVLLYLVGWLMIPDDAGGTALRGFGGQRVSQLIAAALAGIGLLILLDEVTDDSGFPIGLVLVGLGGLFLWSRRNQDDGTDALPTPPPPPPPAPPVPPSDTDRAPLTGLGPTDDPAPPTESLAEPGPPTVTATVPAVAVAAREPKPRSAVVPVTLSLLAVLAGGLSLAGVSVETGLALALLVTAAGLVVGAWRGRAKWLIPVGLVLTMALGAASVIDVPIRGGSGDVVVRPMGLDDLRSPYRLAAGELALNMGAVDLQGQTVTIVASVAAGVLDIVVPADVALDIDAHVGAGELLLLDRLSEGIDVSREVHDPGREGAGRLIVRARVGVGQVEVRRAAA
jgi:phage shock protein PspC (stress-responsive transcriptional regulator)